MTRTSKNSPSQKASGLERELFGRRFQNPILLAAGTAGFGIELAGVANIRRLGAVVTKSVSLEPRAGNAAPRVAEFRGGMLNSIGLANPGVRHVLDMLPQVLPELAPAQVLVSVVGFDAEEYPAVITSLSPVEGIAALELNLSCPNTAAGGIEFGADPRSVEAVVAASRRATDLPLIAKLSPAVPDVGRLARTAVEAGADAIAVVNTMPGRLCDAKGRSRLGHGRGGVSGPALLPIGLHAVVQVAEACPGVPVIGVGGVRTAADVRRYLGAGASLVGIGTAALADPRLPERIVFELEGGHG